MKTRVGWLLVLVAIIAGGARLAVRYLPGSINPVCHAAGKLDTLRVTATDTGGIVGWAADVAGIDHVEMWSGNRLLARAGLTHSRQDLLAARPQCGYPETSGFAFSRGQIPPEVDSVEIRAITRTGKSYAIGHVPVDLSGPFGILDVNEAFEPDARNLVSGWAIAAQGPVTVHVLAQDQEVLTLTAGNLREDVGKVYPAWPEANHSGFEAQLPMSKLPRGSYSLKLVLEDGKGRTRELDGPEVHNDQPFGKVLAQQEKLMPPHAIELRAWLADEDGIAGAMVETEGGEQLGKMSLLQKQLPLSKFHDPRFGTNQGNDAPLAIGSLYGLDLPFDAISPGLHRVQVKVTDGAGKTAILPGPLTLDRNAGAGKACDGKRFRMFLPGGAVNFRDGFRQIKELRDMAAGGCVEIGFRGRLEYLRTTRGKQADYVFDPDFPEKLRKHDGKEMTGESLRELLQTAVKLKAPVMITLDGGVWADARFPDPDYDVVDMLEQDERTVQWNQFGKAEPDDALEHLPGATASPQLARMESLNYYNRRFRDYKKRNLQAAVRDIIAFMRAQPDIYVMVNFDPDEYINPWFYLAQWYDYNPDTLRQYREWLFHLGPYADGGELAFSRHEPALTLDEANRLAKQHWMDVDAVEPPRKTIDYDDEWQQLWTQFKRHLVARHYDDLADWAVAAGMPGDRIYTSQTFIQSDVAVSVTDRADGWPDQAGVSIEGAKPRQGHLGAILYGPSSRNEGKPRSGVSLIDDIRAADPQWGVVEFHPATIAFAEKLPTHAEAYATLRALIDGGARFISPMWGSYAGDHVVHPSSFKSYDSMEGSPFEYQLVWWLRAMQPWPAGSLVYPFGNAQVDSADGWTALPGTTLESAAGQLHLQGEQESLEIASSPWQARVLRHPAELTLTGDWARSARLTAKVELDGGKALSCAFANTGERRASCHFPAAPERQMKQLKLYWQFDHAPARATLDEVVFTQGRQADE